MKEGEERTPRQIPVRTILNSIYIKYTIIPSVFLSFIAFLSFSPNAWIVSDVHHFYFEMFAVVLSTIVAFYCIARAYSLNEKFSLFIGIGFVTIAVIDFLHATLSFLAAGNNTLLDYFIPQTWFAGRTFLGVMLVVAVVKYAKAENFRGQRKGEVAARKYEQEEPLTINSSSWNSRQQQQPTTTGNESTSSSNNALHRGLVFSLIMLAILAISVVGISFFTVFPEIVIHFPLSRPYEIPSFVLFSVALFYFYKRKLYKLEDVFYRGILGALIIDIFGQIIVSSSSVNFHTADNMAHILKDSGYFITVISLAMSSIQHNKIARERAEIIRRQYVKLEQDYDDVKGYLDLVLKEIKARKQE